MALIKSSPFANKTQKGQLKCFHCRKTHALKDGGWHNWQTMQVFLCKACDKITLSRPERASR